MADIETKNVNDSLGDTVHKDGTDYIKEQLAAKNAEGTTAAASESKPENVAPITPAQPPASNPGAEDPTAGIAKDAGGVSSAAHVQSPTANKEKRKSIVGQLTGFLGFGGKKEKEAKNVNEDNTVAGYAAGAATAVAGTTTVLADRTKTTAQESTGIDLGAKDKETANTDTAGSGAGTTTDGTEDTPVTSATKATTEDADTFTGKNETDTSGEADHKPPKPADPKTMENKDAIPVAGGEKLGEKHWGESKIVPDNPKPAGEEGGVSSADGQPSSKNKTPTQLPPRTNAGTEEVSDNTAKNTGGATSGPSGPKSPESEKKEKFMDKLKDKFKGGKKDKQ